MNVELLTQAIERILQGRTGCKVRVYVTENQKKTAICAESKATETKSEED